MKVCIIGNSHIAALKAGLPDVSLGDVEITFFGAPGECLNDMMLEDGIMFAPTEELRRIVRITAGDQGDLRIRDFDAFVVIGLEFGVLPVLRTYRTHRADSHVFRIGAQQIVSDRCFDQTVYDLLNESPAVKLVRRLRSVTDRPILLCEQAAPSESIADFAGWWRQLADSADADALRELVERTIARLPLSAGVSVAPQPEETLVRPILTAQEFSVGSVRLTPSVQDQHPDTDYAHMNATYGALVMRDALRRIEAFA
jgi:hypothetical protein